MTSFGATHVVREPNYMPRFKVQGLYQRVGSLLPVHGEEHKFSQIYFMGTAEEEANQWMKFNADTDREVVTQLQDFLHEHNVLVGTFKLLSNICRQQTTLFVYELTKAPMESTKDDLMRPQPMR